MKKIFPRPTAPLLLAAALTISTSLSVLAQSAMPPGSWTLNPYEQKFFIENRGQFNGKDKQKDAQIHYGVENLGYQIYFTEKGYTYRYDRKEFILTEEGEKDESPRKAGKEGDERKIKTHTFMLNIEWLNSNPDVKIISEDKGPTYFNFAVDNDPAHCINFVPGYRKIKYIGLYPGVDAEYVFHEKEGIKYALIVHPGADVSKIRMKYNGKGNPSVDNNGNIRFSSPYGDIIDHAPISFYADKTPVTSSFSLSGDVVTFNVGAYDKSKTLIIDPWSQNPALTVNNRAYDIHKDGAGNVYVYGGSAPYKVQKYPPGGGAATWVFNSPFSQWYGDMVVDGVGNSYITQGWVNQIAKVTTAGVMLWNTSCGGVFEHWTVAIDCSGNKLTVSGGCCQPFITLINTANGATISTTNVNNTGADVRAQLNAPNGNYYICTSTNLLVGVTGAFAPVFTVATGYAMNYGQLTFNGGYGGRDQLDASKTFLYSSDGLTLIKRNLTTGANLGQINVPGAIVETNDGICVDSCTNVYVSSQAAVYKYDQNLNFINSFATPSVPYCISMGNSGEILVSGNGFIASMAMGACPIVFTPLTASKSSTAASCSASNGTASVTAGGGISPYTYSWNPTGQTSQTATGLSAGTYTVTVTDATGCKTTTQTVQVTGGSGSLTLSTTQNNVSCNGGNNGTATASSSTGTSPYTYSWNPTGQNTQTATGLSAGTYTCTVTDAGGCSSTIAVTVVQPSALTAGISAQTNVSCNGGNNGTATATASGGTGALTYSWNNGQNSANATGLTAGTYTVTVTDGNGCTQTASVTISQPSLLVAGISTQTNVSCNGGNNGSATATASGGSGALTYSWNNGQNSANATGLTAGTYTVTVTDGNGCTKTATVTITQPTVLNAGISVSTTVNCNGGNNGTATATANGGTGAMTYSWNNGQNTSTATGLTAGNYTVTVTDQNGCTKTATVAITQPTVLTLNGSTTTATCGGSNGTATVTASGGTVNYTYSWNNGQTNQTATGLAANSYTVTVTDNKGCTKTMSFTVSNAGSPTAGISTQTNVLCFGGNNGSATVTASGGTGALTYSWNNGQTTTTSTGLTAGTYTVTVTDQNGCSVIATVTITQPVQLAAGISGWSNPNCSGGNNGTASATASGGTGTITYSWSTGATGNSVTGLTAGNYTVTSVDANNCTQMATVVVTQPTAMVTGISTQTNVSCNGGNNGTATATSTGGSGGTQFVWNTGQSSATATGLSAGTYTVTTTDVNGCTRTASVTITQPTLINLQTSTVNSTCGQSNGTATVTASGGTGAFTYSWSSGAQTTQTATGLAANTYTVLVTDANGCTKTATVTVVNAGSPSVGVTTQTNVSCFGGNNGTATATASGGTGALTYSWAPNGGNGLTGTGMTAGTYTITVTDQNGCSATATVTITQPTQLTAAAAVGTNVSCTGGNNGSAGVTAAGGTVNYTYSWNNGQTNQAATGLTAGTYTVTVTDSKGCTATATATVTQPTQLTAGISAQINVSCNGGNNGSATVTAAGGLANYTFVWSNTQNTATATSLTAGTYTVTVTDANNCTATATVTITQPTLLTLQTSTVSSTCSQANGTATVTASGGTGSYSYSWNNSQNTQTATGLLAGSYTVTVSDANGCSKTATVSVTNLGSPTAGISASTNVSCFGGNDGTATATGSGGTGTLTYTWAPSGGNTANGTGMTAGTYTVTVTDQNGCTATATVTITEPTQLTVIAAGTTTCQGTAGTAGCTANGGTTNYNYSWSNGQLTQVATGLATGVYTVTVTDANNCTATATANIVVNPLPVIIISASDTAGCAPLCVNFTCTTGNITSWSWDFDDAGSGSSNTSTLQNPSHCFKNPGSYDIKITVTDGNGCTATITKTAWINVYPNVVAAFTAAPQPTTVLNPFITFTDQSTGANTWNWTFGESSSGSNNTSILQNPTHTYKDSGCYNVELIANNQYNCPDTANEIICIAGDYELYAPNAFTPNGDGLNDVWNVKGIGIDPNHFELYIFDRWGNLIFYEDDMNQGWNGHANHGKDIAQQDVYVWKCFTRDFLGGKHSYIGHINLVR